MRFVTEKTRLSLFRFAYRQFPVVLLSFLFFIPTGCGKFFVQTAGPVVAQPAEQTWPYEQSDLAPDPQAFFGRLPNGLRYILKENQTPRDRVSMHLYVQCGSLFETDGEQGIAHFLEHMQFDGSTDFPPGELVKYFQRIGMRFGPDANAHTGFDRTVFDVVLPKGDLQNIAEGLKVLKEYAQGALLLPEQVEKEKKVVLAEKRTRDSADYRTLEASLKFELPGTLLARRLPIGEDETIERFNVDMLRAFYDRWYRPERMILLLVGQFDTPGVSRLIQEQFGDLQPRAAAASHPAFGTFKHSGVKAFYHFERESGATSVHIETAELRALPSDSAAYQRTELLKTLADRIVQRRLDALVQMPKSILISARADSGYYAQRIRYAEISADCQPGNWAAALSSIEQTLRQALIFGFTPSELERAVSVFRADLQRDLNEENTRDNKVIAGRIIGSLNDWRVFQSPGQRMALLAPMLDDVTPEQVHQAFKDTWAASHRLVLVTGNVDLNGDSGPATPKILSAYQQSRQAVVQTPTDQANLQFPYLPEPSPKGVVKEKTVQEDLGIVQVVFANGVHLVMKKTAFKENEVMAALSFGRGRSSEPADEAGLALLTEKTAAESGFGAMDRVALENALAGRLASISLDVGEDRFLIKGKAATADLPLLFQLYQAAIQDPSYRDEAMQVALKQLAQEYTALSHNVDGLIRLEGQRFLAGGDSRMGWPSWKDIDRLSLDQIKAWFGRQLTQAPLEIAMVGDFDPDQVIELAARYLGGLPARVAEAPAEHRSGPVFPEGKTLRLKAETEIDKALVAVVYPTTDFWDIQLTRRLNLLAEIISEKLRVRVREKLGAAYSPYAYHLASRAYPGYGLFYAFVSVAPGQAGAVVEEVKQIAAQVASRGVTADEMRRAVEPTLAHIKDLRQSNIYWLNSVLVDSSQHPEQLSWARTIESDYAAITAEEVNALAKRYLDNRKAAVIEITPERSEQ